MKQEDFFKIIEGERKYQDRKWGTVQEHPHELLGWAKIVELRWQRVNDALANVDHDEAMMQMIKTAAVICAAMEQHC